MINKIINETEEQITSDPSDINNILTQINTIKTDISNICPIYYRERVGYVEGGTGWYSVFTINATYSNTHPYYYELYYGNSFNYTETSLTKIGILKGYKRVELTKLLRGPGSLRGPFSKIRTIQLGSTGYLCIQLFANRDVYDTDSASNDMIFVKLLNYGWIGATLSSNSLAFYNKTDDMLNDDELITELVL